MSSDGADLPICVTCGVQYGEPRGDCPICEDDRQYVGWDGQRWTSLAELRAGEYRARIEDEGPDVVGVGIRPSFAIGQRALLLRTGQGNILWDCVPYLDDEMVARINGLGGIDAIAISHPHYYSTIVEWGRAFGAPVYVHESDAEWLGRRDSNIVLWKGERHELGPGLTLLDVGIHFAGGSVLHWRDAEDGRGALFTGDIFQVVMDRRWMSFMRSYPNLIPERPRVVRRAVEMVRPYAYEKVYGAWWRRIVVEDGAAAVQRSAERYLEWVRED